MPHIENSNTSDDDNKLSKSLNFALSKLKDLLSSSKDLSGDYPNIISDLNAQVEKLLSLINSTESVDLITLINIVENTRQLANVLYTHATLEEESALVEIAHPILLTLAELIPTNTKDEIDSENQVVISTGEQFDIYQLIKTHNSRALNLGRRETEQEKLFIHPKTQEPLSPEDVAHIQKIAAQRNIQIVGLVTGEQLKKMNIYLPYLLRNVLKYLVLTKSAQAAALIPRRFLELFSKYPKLIQILLNNYEPTLKQLYAAGEEKLTLLSAHLDSLKILKNYAVNFNDLMMLPINDLKTLLQNPQLLTQILSTKSTAISNDNNNTNQPATSEIQTILQLFIDAMKGLAKTGPEIQKAVTEPRRKLTAILLNANLCGNLKLALEAHAALIKLAELAPLNLTDPILFDNKIAPENKIFLSTGELFDIKTLINFHIKRQPNKDEDNEHKYLFHPHLQEPFSDLDTAHIIKTAQEKNIKIPSLKTQPQNNRHQQIIDAILTVIKYQLALLADEEVTVLLQALQYPSYIEKFITLYNVNDLHSLQENIDALLISISLEEKYKEELLALSKVNIFTFYLLQLPEDVRLLILKNHQKVAEYVNGNFTTQEKRTTLGSKFLRLNPQTIKYILQDESLSNSIVSEISEILSKDFTAFTQLTAEQQIEAIENRENILRIMKYRDFSLMSLFSLEKEWRTEIVKNFIEIQRLGLSFEQLIKLKPEIRQISYQNEKDIGEIIQIFSRENGKLIKFDAEQFDADELKNPYSQKTLHKFATLLDRKTEISDNDINKMIIDYYDKTHQATTTQDIQVATREELLNFNPWFLGKIMSKWRGGIQRGSGLQDVMPPDMRLTELSKFPSELQNYIFDNLTLIKFLIESGILLSLRELKELDLPNNPDLTSQLQSKQFLDFINQNPTLIQKIVSGYRTSKSGKINFNDLIKYPYFTSELKHLETAGVDFSQLVSLPFAQQEELFKYRLAFSRIEERFISFDKLMQLTAEQRKEIFEHSTNIKALFEMGMSLEKILALKPEIRLLIIKNANVLFLLHRAGIPYTEVLKLDTQPVTVNFRNTESSVLEQVLYLTKNSAHSDSLVNVFPKIFQAHSSFEEMIHLSQEEQSRHGFDIFAKLKPSEQIEFLQNCTNFLQLLVCRPDSENSNDILRLSFEEIFKLEPTWRKELIENIHTIFYIASYLGSKQESFKTILDKLSKLTPEQHQVLYRNYLDILPVLSKFSISLDQLREFPPEALANIYSDDAQEKLASFMVITDSDSVQDQRIKLFFEMSQFILMETSEEGKGQIKSDIQNYLMNPNKANIDFPTLISLKPSVLFTIVQNAKSIAKLVPKYISFEDFLALETLFQFDVIQWQRFIRRDLLDTQFVSSLKELEQLELALRSLVLFNSDNIAALKQANVHLKDFLEIEPLSLRDFIIENGKNLSELLKQAKLTLKDILILKEPLRTKVIKESDTIVELIQHGFLFSDILNMPSKFRNWLLDKYFDILSIAQKFKVSPIKLLELGQEKIGILHQAKINNYTYYSNLTSFISFDDLKNKITCKELQVVSKDTHTTQAENIFKNILPKRSAFTNALLELDIVDDHFYIQNRIEIDEIISLEKREFNQENLEVIKNVRQKLTSLYQRATTEQNYRLSQRAHNVLLVLAQLSPTNPNENIQSDNRVYVSTGEQFDIYRLIKTHADRKAITERGETTENKYFVNPITHQIFSPEDLAHIQQAARERKIAIPVLLVEEEKEEKIEVTISRESTLVASNSERFQFENKLLEIAALTHDHISKQVDFLLKEEHKPYAERNDEQRKALRYFALDLYDESSLNTLKEQLKIELRLNPSSFAADVFYPLLMFAVCHAGYRSKAYSNTINMLYQFKMKHKIDIRIGYQEYLFALEHSGYSGVNLLLGFKHDSYLKQPITFQNIIDFILENAETIDFATLHQEIKEALNNPNYPIEKLRLLISLGNINTYRNEENNKENEEDVDYFAKIYTRELKNSNQITTKALLNFAFFLHNIYIAGFYEKIKPTQSSLVKTITEKEKSTSKNTIPSTKIETVTRHTDNIDPNNNTTQSQGIPILSYAQTTNRFFQPTPELITPTVKFSEFIDFIIYNSVAIYFDNLPAEIQKIIQEKNLNKNEIELSNKLTNFDLTQFNTLDNVAEFVRVFEDVSKDISVSSYLNCETLLNFALTKGCENFYNALLNCNISDEAAAFVKLYPICKQHSSVVNGLINYLDSQEEKHKDLISKLKKVIEDSVKALKDNENIIHILARKICSGIRFKTSEFPDEIRMVSDFLKTLTLNSYYVNPQLYGKTNVSNDNNLNNNRMPS